MLKYNENSKLINFKQELGTSCLLQGFLVVGIHTYQCLINWLCKWRWKAEIKLHSCKTCKMKGCIMMVTCVHYL